MRYFPPSLKKPDPDPGDTLDLLKQVWGYLVSVPSKNRDSHWEKVTMGVKNKINSWLHSEL